MRGAPQSGFFMVCTVRGTLVVIDCGTGLHGFGLKLLSAGEPFSRAVADGLEGFPNAYPSSTSTTYTAGNRSRDWRETTHVAKEPELPASFKMHRLHELEEQSSTIVPDAEH